MNKYANEIMDRLDSIYGIEFYGDSEPKAFDVVSNVLKKVGVKVKTDCAKAVCDCVEVCETPNGHSAILADDAYEACLGVKVA